MRRLLATAATLTVVLIPAGCGDEEDAPSSGGGTTTVEITFENGSVEPSGETVEVPRGDDVQLVVEADEPGELHVHTNTEQELSYAAGTTTLKVPLSGEPPGVVEVESHDLEQVVVQLEIR